MEPSECSTPRTRPGITAKSVTGWGCTMLEEEPTGRLSWKPDPLGWSLREDIELRFGSATYSYPMSTEWWIYRFAPFWPWPYEVHCLNAPGLKPVRMFWSLRKAKA